MLEPWILNPFAEELITEDTPEIVLNCKSKKYSNIFTGKVLQAPRAIIDFVPFGYDVEKLFIRLYELYDHVDAFVIYESTRTQTAISKPLYFSKLKSSPIIEKFLNKIIYLYSDDKEIESYISTTKEEMNLRSSGKVLFHMFFYRQRHT